MNETLQEFVDSRGVAMRVDRQAGVIRGSEGAGPEVAQRPDLSARGLGPGRRALRRREGERQPPQDEPLRAARLPGPHRRDPQRRSRGASEGLFADFHFNPKHALAEQLLWDAEHAPENVGFSHNVEARTSRRGEEVVVEAILRVQSVDLVADPATTRGLFESTGDAEPTRLRRWPRPPSSISGEHRADLVEAILSEPAAELRAASGRSRAAPAGRGHGREEPRWSADCLSESDLPDPDSGDPWAAVDRQPPVRRVALGRAGRGGHAGADRGAGRAGARDRPAKPAATSAGPSAASRTSRARLAARRRRVRASDQVG